MGDADASQAGGAAWGAGSGTPKVWGVPRAPKGSCGASKINGNVGVRGSWSRTGSNRKGNGTF